MALLLWTNPGLRNDAQVESMRAGKEAVRIASTEDVGLKACTHSYNSYWNREVIDSPYSCYRHPNMCVTGGLAKEGMEVNCGKADGRPGPNSCYEEDLEGEYHLLKLVEATF